MLRWRKRIGIICLIGDIDGLRDNDAKLLADEVRFFRTLRYFIVHTPAMRQWLLQVHPGSQASVLGLFDYLADAGDKQPQKTNEVVFAANLQKSSFVKQLDEVAKEAPGIIFHLYGPGGTQADWNQSNIHYHGILPPYDLPNVINGSFGLVWDGDSTSGCTGGYGEYLLYNSQHKLSLYLVSHLPVIIWERAATATFVLEQNLGITINNLHEIPGKLSALTHEEYDAMVLNTKAWAQKLASGFFLKHALDEIMPKATDAIKK